MNTKEILREKSEELVTCANVCRFLAGKDREKADELNELASRILTASIDLLEVMG